MEADDHQVMTVFTVQPPFHHLHSTNHLTNEKKKKTRQTEYHEVFPSSANVQSHLTSPFANDGTASWYSVCGVPMVERPVKTVVTRRWSASMILAAGTANQDCPSKWRTHLSLQAMSRPRSVDMWWGAGGAPVLTCWGQHPWCTEQTCAWPEYASRAATSATTAPAAHASCKHSPVVLLVAVCCLLNVPATC